MCWLSSAEAAFSGFLEAGIGMRSVSTCSFALGLLLVSGTAFALGAVANMDKVSAAWRGLSFRCLGAG